MRGKKSVRHVIGEPEYIEELFERWGRTKDSGFSIIVPFTDSWSKFYNFFFKTFIYSLIYSLDRKGRMFYVSKFVKSGY